MKAAKKKQIIILAAVIALLLIITGVFLMKNQQADTISGIVVDTYDNKIRLYSDTTEDYGIIDAVCGDGTKLPAGMQNGEFGELLYMRVTVTYDGKIADLGPPFTTIQRLVIDEQQCSEAEIEEARAYYENSFAY